LIRILWILCLIYDYFNWVLRGFSRSRQKAKFNLEWDFWGFPICLWKEDSTKSCKKVNLEDFIEIPRD
jgi:hypothetical protein